MSKKYKLIRVGKLGKVHSLVPDYRLFQIQALRDIPEHGVKAGDLGGYVKNRRALSHRGSCWIGGQARVLSKVKVFHDAYIGDNAIVDGDYECPISIGNNVKVIDNAVVLNRYQNMTHQSFLEDAFKVSGRALIMSLSIGSGIAEVCGEARITGAKLITDEAKIYGHAEVHQDAQIFGKSRIYDNAIISKGAKITDSDIYGQTRTSSYSNIINSSNANLVQLSVDDEADLFFEKDIVMDTPSLVAINGSLAPVNENKNPVQPLAGADDSTKKILNEYNEIIADIDAYQTDIVKIIKYPVMTDSTDPHTLNMALALKKAKRLAKTPADPDFKTAIADLEAKFTIAESNALRIAATNLSDSDQKKTKLAKDMLNKASDEASTENEKKIAFQQGFKQLEGVIAVPEIAIDTFRVKIGLKELEM